MGKKEENQKKRGSLFDTFKNAVTGKKTETKPEPEKKPVNQQQVESEDVVSTANTLLDNQSETIDKFLFNTNRPDRIEFARVLVVKAEGAISYLEYNAKELFGVNNEKNREMQIKLSSLYSQMATLSEVALEGATGQTKEKRLDDIKKYEFEAQSWLPRDMRKKIKAQQSEERSSNSPSSGSDEEELSPEDLIDNFKVIFNNKNSELSKEKLKSILSTSENFVRPEKTEQRKVRFAEMKPENAKQIAPITEKTSENSEKKERPSSLKKTGTSKNLSPSEEGEKKPENKPSHKLLERKAFSQRNIHDQKVQTSEIGALKSGIPQNSGSWVASTVKGVEEQRITRGRSLVLGEKNKQDFKDLVDQQRIEEQQKKNSRDNSPKR